MKATEYIARTEEAVFHTYNRFPVVFESGDGDGSLGHSDTYLRVRVPEPGLHGRMLPVRILSAEDTILSGRLV